jgi:hypothetical protein
MRHNIVPICGGSFQSPHALRSLLCPLCTRTWRHMRILYYET